MAERNRRCAEAGIPERYYDMTIETVPAFSPELMLVRRDLSAAAASWRGGARPTGQFVLQGTPQAVRVIGFLMVKAALYRWSGHAVGLDDLTDMRFDREEKKGWKRARDSDLLVVFAGPEARSAGHRQTMQAVLDHRADPQFCTVAATSLSADLLTEYFGDHPLWRSGSRYVTLPREDLPI